LKRFEIKELGEDICNLVFGRYGEKMEELGLKLFTNNVTVDVDVFFGR